MTKKSRSTVFVNPEFASSVPETTAHAAQVRQPTTPPVRKQPKFNIYDLAVAEFRKQLPDMKLADVVAFLNNPTKTVVNRAARRTTSDLTDLKTRIVEVLQASPNPMKAAEIRQATGATKEQLLSPMKRLIAEKLIRRSGKKSLTIYSAA